MNLNCKQSLTLELRTNGMKDANWCLAKQKFLISLMN
jgi:hypothetical protein